MDEFNWMLIRRSVVRLSGPQRSGWYFLSQGQKNWKLRTFDPYAEYSHDPLLDDVPGQVGVQLTMPQVDCWTDLPASTTPHDDHETWAQILAALTECGNNPPPIPPGGLPPIPREPGGAAPQQPAPAHHCSPIPVTKLYRLYETLKKLVTSLESHLTMAREIDRVAGRLPTYFTDSWSHFSRYANIGEPFVPPGARDPLPDVATITDIRDTRTLIALIAEDPNRVWTVDGDPSLSFKYVEREIVLARTTGNAVYEDGRRARGTQLDGLFRNDGDGTPVIAEIKIGNDASPFYALIQLLMYASELATPAQLQRLQRHYGNQAFYVNNGEPDATESVSLYIVISKYNYNSPVRESLLDATDRLAASLIKDTALNAIVKRIACVEATFENQSLAFKVLFSHAPPDDN